MSAVSDKNLVLPENIVWVYSKVFVSFEIQVFKKTRVYALEDSLGVYLNHEKKFIVN